jgi:hypothetical protein
MSCLLYVVGHCIVYIIRYVMFCHAYVDFQGLLYGNMFIASQGYSNMFT